MTIYIISYVVTFCIVSNLDCKNNIISTKIKLALCIIILSVLAGFRDEYVGTDTLTYAKPLFNVAKSSSNLTSFMSFMTSSSLGIENGYSLLVYISSRLFNDFHGLLFLTSVIINTSVILGLYKMKNTISVSTAIMIYCFLFYQQSYNAMRQWMAIGIIIFGFNYIYEHKPIKYLITILIAIQFHASAFIAISLYIINAICTKLKKKWVYIGITIGTVIFIFTFQVLINKLIGIGVLSSKYMHYTQGEELGLSWVDILVKTPVLILCAIFHSRMKQVDKNHSYLLLLVVLDLIISQVSSIVVFAGRIALYFTIARMFELSILCNINKICITDISIKKDVYIFKFITYVYIVFYWYVNYIYLAHGDTYPYTSSILGI